MGYMVTGMILAITVFAVQQPTISTTVDWTTILIAFLTGAFGSNGISKIIDSLATLREVAELKDTIQKMSEEHKKEIFALKKEMKLQQEQYNAELRRIMRFLTEGRDDDVTPTPG